MKPDAKAKPEAGHAFLAKLGKRRLRPGGIKATNWLIDRAHIHPGMRLLEVACNMATTSIELAKKYQVSIDACDIKPEVIDIARANIKKHNIENIKLHVADATHLPFEDNTFDLVMNEAMLTMLPDGKKRLALNEYFRVLKPGGSLLTHDVCLRVESPDEQEKIRVNLSRAINVNVRPHDPEDWKIFFIEAGYTDVTSVYGPLSLMNPLGMIRDEGFPNTLRILKNGLKKENRAQFIGMFKMFKGYQKELGYIAFIAQKPKV